MTSYTRPSHSDNFKLLGVTVVGPRPLGIQHVQLREGLNVLYGKNGSGKTRLLEAVSNMLTAKSEERQSFLPDFSNNPWEVLFKMGGIHFSLPVLSEDLSIVDKIKMYRTWEMTENDAYDNELEAFLEENGRDWQPGNFLESIHKWLLTQPWERRSNVATPQASASSHRFEQEETNAFKLGLDESQVTWLLENGRWFFEPLSRNLFLCDDQPGSSPLAEIWFKSQEYWANELEEDAQAELGKLTYSKSTYGEWEWEAWPFSTPESHALSPLFSSLGLDELPTWAAYPVLKVPYSPHWVQDLVDGDDIQKLREIKTRWGPLTDATIRHLEFLNDQIWDDEKQTNRKIKRGDTFNSKIYVEECKRLSETSSQKMKGLFEDAPSLQLEKIDTQKISRGAPVRWTAQFPGETKFLAEELGFAHRRYADFVILQELRENRQNNIARAVDRNRDSDISEFDSQFLLVSPSVLIVDEPERGLHPLAAKHLSESISTIGEITLVATHSVEFLDTGIRNESASLIERDPKGFVSIKQLPQLSEQLENVISERLGLTPAALVNLTSIFVLVEGPHDELILQHYFDELRQKYRIQVLPMVGTRGIKDLATSDFLFTATSSPIAIIVDNGKQASIDKLMSRLRSTNNQSERFSIAHQYLSEFNSKEMKEIYGLIQQAIKADRLDRIHPCALGEGDILRYLPMEYICPKFKSWSDLDTEFLVAQGRSFFKEGDGKTKKDWITKLGGNVTIPRIKQVLKQCGAENLPTPKDILQLRFKLEELIRNTRATSRN